MREFFQLFAYGSLMDATHAREVLHDATVVGSAHVLGTLYDIAGEYSALMLYGDTRVDGIVWQCRAELLPSIDAYEDVAGGSFRRVATDVVFGDGRSETACWLYVAGPGIAHALTPEARVDDGKWQRSA